MNSKSVVPSLLLLALVGYGCVSDNSPLGPDPISEQGGDPFLAGSGGLPGAAMVVRLIGDAEAYEGTVPDIDGDGVEDPALCFDVDILDAAGRHIGTATDCLSNITGVGDGMALVGTTTFRLANGTFVSRGSTTVQPVTTTAPTPATHTTGAIPMEGSNGILSGTGAYRNFQAEVRLSGAVNLSRLESDGRIAFDCLFAVTPLR